MDKMVDALEFGNGKSTQPLAENGAIHSNTHRLKYKIFLLDNFDSFTYNLKYQLQELGDVKTYRNNLNLETLVSKAKDCDLIVLSPGPGNPGQAGNLLAFIKALAGQVPMFGICLGHQALVEAFSGVVGPAPAILHGKTSDMQHNGESLFKDLPNPLAIARYHSLVASEIPANFTVTASVDGQVMAVEDTKQKLFGVQFHPESILTTYGQNLFENVFECVGLN